MDVNTKNTIGPATQRRLPGTTGRSIQRADALRFVAIAMTARNRRYRTPYALNQRDHARWTAYRNVDDRSVVSMSSGDIRMASGSGNRGGWGGQAASRFTPAPGSPIADRSLL